MKQYKITSADFLGIAQDAVIPDAFLSTDDKKFVNSFNTINSVVQHLQQVINQTTQDTQSDE